MFVRCNSWYIHMPSSAKQQREMNKFYVFWKTRMMCLRSETKRHPEQIQAIAKFKGKIYRFFFLLGVVFGICRHCLSSLLLQQSRRASILGNKSHNDENAGRKHWPKPEFKRIWQSCPVNGLYLSRCILKSRQIVSQKSLRGSSTSLILKNKQYRCFIYIG